MATRRKKPTAADLSGNSDPHAPLDGAALLAAAKPLLKELAADLLARADGSRAVTEALQARHAQEQKAERTADAYPEWRRALVEQVAAAWLLSCVFVRTLEDRGLLGKNRIAGPGAQDSWKAFLQLAPSLSEREYLLTVFRELARLPAAADLFDARHNPVWLLAPSAEGARKLLDLFRAPHADAPTFRFGGDDTRFLGDLYQDLSEDVRKRYALLQTPRFVESFILDRTLEPAIERFGLDDTNLIDPTCGSGHFLLGAFERLFDHRLRAEPGLSPREAASKALDAVAGSDINPYAVAIARFRLTLAFIEKCGLTRLKDVPRLPLHLAVADSLLYNPQIGQLALVEGTDPSKWEGSHFSLEDPKAARDVLFKQYAAVVGNPPYIVVKDPVLRERYRSCYASAFRSYSLAVPFTERFFQLGRAGARVGMITANSFMKREFGRMLIEKYLPSVNLDLIVNTSGAYIPGHGTPTVLLFATNEKPKGSSVKAVLANRGEPSTPSDPEAGVVWSSIANHWREDGFENDYVSVAQVQRDTLSKHPWSLGGGGAGDLKELLEERAEGTLANSGVDIGTSAVTREDDVFLLGEATLLRSGIPREFWRPLVAGENVRDWSVSDPVIALWPYDHASLSASQSEAIRRFLWPWRAQLSGRVAFGKSQVERGLPYTAYSMFFANRFRGLTISFAFVATHNHFVLDRDEKVFGRTAPIIKLPETATEDDHLALLAYLNSSTACFLMRQVMSPKGMHNASKSNATPYLVRFEFDGTKMARLPLPDLTPYRERLVSLGRAIDNAQKRRSEATFASVAAAQPSSLREELASAEGRRTAEFQLSVALQEEIDWTVYEAFGLLDQGGLDASHVEGIALGCRPFEVALAKSGGTALEYFEWHKSSPTETFPAGIPSAQRTLYESRLDAIASVGELRLLESPECKRRWIQPSGKAAQELQTDAKVLRDEAATWVANVVEEVASGLGASTWRGSKVVGMLASNRIFLEALDWLGLGSHETATIQNIADNAVPYVAGHRLTESGMDRRSSWEAAWEAQRREDSGIAQKLASPSKYEQDDFRDIQFWRLRGPLDVPKERFISYPGCESDEDKEPVYGWAGWDHLQRAVALAGLYQDRKQREGWTKDRLLPMLAGLLELLPWLKQWHHEPSADLGGERPSDQFEAFLNAECSEFGFTHDDLRAWRPTAKTRGGSKKPKVSVPAPPTES